MLASEARHFQKARRVRTSTARVIQAFFEKNIEDKDFRGKGSYEELRDRKNPRMKT